MIEQCPHPQVSSHPNLVGMLPSIAKEGLELSLNAFRWEDYVGLSGWPSVVPRVFKSERRQRQSEGDLTPAEWTEK